MFRANYKVINLDRLTPSSAVQFILPNNNLLYFKKINLLAYIHIANAHQSNRNTNSLLYSIPFL
jgi:hypothetical protein